MVCRGVQQGVDDWYYYNAFNDRSALRGVSDDHSEQMGAAESSESEDSGGIASQILRLKMAKSNGQMSEEEYEAGGPLPLRACCFLN